MLNFFSTSIGSLNAYDFEDDKTKDDMVEQLTAQDLRKLSSMFIFKGKDIGEDKDSTIPQWYLKMLLLCRGKCIVREIKGKLYVLFGELGGSNNFNYFPSKFIYANPYLPVDEQSKQCKIGVDCALLKNDSLMLGFKRGLIMYNSILAECLISLRMLSINKRFMNIGVAPTDSAKRDLDDILSGIKKGKVVIKTVKDFSSSIKTIEMSNQGNNRNITEMVELCQYIIGLKNQFISLNSSFNMKREALNASETTLNEESLLPTIDDLVQTYKENCEKVNALYPDANWSVEINSTWKNSIKEADLNIKNKESEISKISNSGQTSDQNDDGKEVNNENT